MDDPSAEVRTHAAQCIGELKLSIDATADIDSWKAVVKHILNSLILHLDGPEINFRKTLLGKDSRIEQTKTELVVKIYFLIRINGKIGGQRRDGCCISSDYC